MNENFDTKDWVNNRASFTKDASRLLAQVSRAMTAFWADLVSMCVPKPPDPELSQAGVTDLAGIEGTDLVLDHCVIHVSDWVRSNAFYQSVFGAKVIPLGNGFAYKFGGGQLNCHGPGVIGAPIARLPVMPGGSDICVEWPKPIQAAVDFLAARRVGVEYGPVPRIGAKGQGVSVYFRDPDGSLLEFISYA